VFSIAALSHRRLIVLYPELVERGTWKAIFRLAKQFGSLSPVFEVFSTQIYTHSILGNLTFGGARYIATGREFATTHLFQHPVLAVRWSEHILGHEDAYYAALCNIDVVDALSHLLLGYGVVAVHCAILVQPASVCILRLYH